MIREIAVIYREEQRFGAWLRWLVVLSMALAVPFVSLVLVKSPEPIDTAEIVAIIAAGICVPIFVGVLFFMFKLVTEVRADGVYVRFFPFHIRFKRFGVAELSEYYARKYRPIVEYGGWGIKWGRKGKAYNVSGNNGVQLVFKNDRRLLIGSQRAEELEEAIRSIVESN